MDGWMENLFSRLVFIIIIIIIIIMIIKLCPNRIGKLGWICSMAVYLNSHVSRLWICNLGSYKLRRPVQWRNRFSDSQKYFFPKNKTKTTNTCLMSSSYLSHLLEGPGQCPVWQMCWLTVFVCPTRQLSAAVLHSLPTARDVSSLPLPTPPPPPPARRNMAGLAQNTVKHHGRNK